MYNPPDRWVRSESCFEPIIERQVFMRAKKIIEERRTCLPEEQMLVRLRRTLMKKGRLSPAIIDGTIGLPCTSTYMRRFGSLRNVYRLIGYTSRKNCEYIESRAAWADLMAKLASQVAAKIEKAGGQAVLNCSSDCLRLNEAMNIAFRVARWCPKPSTHWSIQRRAALPTGWIVAIRLGEHNRDVLDYVLLPTGGIVRPLIRFSENARVDQESNGLQASTRSLDHSLDG